MIREKTEEKHIKLLNGYGISGAGNADISLRRFKSGEYIYRQGYEIDSLLFIIEGTMKVVFSVPNGRALLLCSYESGVVGDVELLQGIRTAASSVQAITDVTCLGMPLKRAQEELAGNILFTKKIAEGMALKLTQSSRNSAVNILNPLEARLCSYIALTSIGGMFMEKRTVLSEILGTSYRHLLRTLDKLCAGGVLRREKKGYRIIDKKKLEETGGDYYLI